MKKKKEKDVLRNHTTHCRNLEYMVAIHEPSRLYPSVYCRGKELLYDICSPNASLWIFAVRHNVTKNSFVLHQNKLLAHPCGVMS